MKNKISFILISLVVFFVISISTLYSLSINNNDILTRQIIWYLIGFLLIIFTYKKKLSLIINYSTILYIVGNFLLLLLLFFGTEINGSKCWFIIPNIGSLQVSEFMKLFLILINTKILVKRKKKKPKFKDDIKTFFIIFIITLIPSILTFLEPDTGMVIIYFLISFVMLFVYGIRKSIFIVIIVLISILITGFLYYYFNYQDSFINLFGTSFFYRIDRLLYWSSKSGMQLTNATTVIKAAGLFGYGIGKIPVYIPEAHTDFIFSSFVSSFGFIGAIILILTILVFDINLLIYSIKVKNIKLKYIIIGFTAMIIYQQIQNIGMNIGLLPITGITLPFISYGGSSLLSYMLGITLIINYNKKTP